MKLFKHVLLPTLIFASTWSQQNGAISVPDTVEDEGEGSDGTPDDDVESAPVVTNKGGAVKFGWIRGVLVSYDGL